MATAVVTARKPIWRPSSVGIGSSLTLSGGTGKLPSYMEKEWNSTSNRPFAFPKVTYTERRVQSAPKVVSCWKNPQIHGKTGPSYSQVSETEHSSDENSDGVELTAEKISQDFQKWIKKSEYYRGTGALLSQKFSNPEIDKRFLTELDDVKKQIQHSPENLIVSIKAVMAEKRKRMLTARSNQLNHQVGQHVSSRLSTRTAGIQIFEGAQNVSSHNEISTDKNNGEMNSKSLEGKTSLTYHEILRAAINNNSSSSSSVSAFVNSPEISSGNERDNSNGSRQTSSSSSTSVALERKSYSKTPQYQTNRQARQKPNGVTQSHDRHSSNDTLPIVCTDENANTSLQTLPLTSKQTRSHQSPIQPTPQKIYPATTTPKTQRINSLSISGIKQDNGSVSRGDDTTTEEEDHRPVPPAISDGLPSKPSPPSLQVYTTTTQPINGAPSQSFGLSARRKTSKPLQSSGRSSHGKQKADLEPKYADPIAGSTPSFQSRLAELASLEAETVRWERLRKLKKKSRDD